MRISGFLLLLLSITTPAEASVLVRDAGGETIGVLLGLPSDGGSGGGWKAYQYEILNEQGYRFKLYAASGYVDEPDFPNLTSFAEVGPFWAAYYAPNKYYDSTDCSGTPYTPTTIKGVVYTYERAPHSEPIELYYIPKDATFSVKEPVRYQDFFSDECKELDKYMQARFPAATVPVFPNDPNETGVTEGAFTPPIEFVPTTGAADCIFSDSFQCQ
jgi:hypothetical protein